MWSKTLKNKKQGAKALRIQSIARNEIAEQSHARLKIRDITIFGERRSLLCLEKNINTTVATIFVVTEIHAPAYVSEAQAAEVSSGVGQTTCP